MKKGQNKHIAILMTLILFLSLICTNSIPINADESAKVNTTTLESASTPATGQDQVDNSGTTQTPSTDTSSTQARSGDGTNVSSPADTSTSTDQTTASITPPAEATTTDQTTADSMLAQPDTTVIDDPSATQPINSMEENALKGNPNEVGSDGMEWTPASFYIYETTGKLPVVNKANVQARKKMRIDREAAAAAAARAATPDAITDVTATTTATPDASTDVSATTTATPDAATDATASTSATPAENTATTETATSTPDATATTATTDAIAIPAATTDVTATVIPATTETTAASANVVATTNTVVTAAADGLNPDLNIGNMQLFVNNIAGRRAINHSDRPELADRNNASESIDSKTAGALTLRRTDLSLPGKDGLDLILGRYYSSSEAAISTRKVNLEYVHNKLNVGECTYGWELYMINMSGQQIYYGLYDSMDAAFITGEQKYNDEPGQWQNYTTFQRNMDLYEYYNSIKFKNYGDTDNFLRNRYDLGAGWSFAFPSIESVSGDSCSPYLTFHDGTGGAYELNITSDTSDSNLSGYQGKDIVVDLCSTLNKSYNNGVESAVYAYIERGQKEYYFSSDGRLLGIKDKKGNEIKFTYITRTVYGTPHQYIVQILDTVGRTVNFTYADNPDMTGSIGVTVNEPGGKNLSLSYVKDSFDYAYSDYTWNADHTKITNEDDTPTRKEPRLAQYIDPKGNEIKYTYENKPVDFSFNWMSISFTPVGLTNARDTVCMLTQIEYPQSRTYYTNQQSLKILGQANGHYKDYVLTGRYDTELLNNSGTISEGPAKNQSTYSSTGNYTYKLFHQSDRTYNFTTVRNGLTSTQTFNMKGQETTDLASDGFKQVATTNNDWDNRFNLKPRSTIVIESEVASGNSRSHYCDRTFNDWGALETSTDGITGQQQDRMQKYYYTDTNNKYMLTRKEWNQNTGIPLSEVYQYNTEGRLTQLTDANGEAINYAYSTTADGKVKDTTKVLEDGKTARTSEICGSLSNNAYPTEVRQYYTGAPNGYTKTTSTYNMLLGLPETVTDDAGNQTIYAYDELGRVVSAKLPDVNNYSVEQVTSYQVGVTSPLFDAVNQNLMTTLVDSYVVYKEKPNGPEQRYNEHKTYYNGYGQLILDTVNNEQLNNWIVSEQCHYDSYGRLIYEIDATGNINTYQYDSWDNLTTSTDPYGNTYKEEISYPGAKMVLSYFLPAGSSTPEHQYKAYYDNFDKLFKVQEQASGLTELYDYDVVGNVRHHTDPMNNISIYGYDNLNQLNKVTDSLTQVTDYTYTKLGKIKDVTITEGTENDITSRGYDELGRQKQKTDPGGLINSLTYNNLGLVDTSTDPNGTAFSYTYDNQNRVLTQSGGGIAYQYQYANSPYGAATITLNNGSAVTYSYDGLGRIATKTVNVGGSNSTVSYQYDNAGKETNIVSPTGQSTSYHYDKTRLDQVQYENGKSIGYEYYPDGKVKTVSYPALTDGSILKSSYEYDSLDRLTKLSNLKGTTILSQYQYTYDDNSNIKTITTPSGGTTTYYYDVLNRLQQVQRPNGQNTSYTYDARGNRKTTEGSVPAVNQAELGCSYNALDQLTGVTKSGQTTSYTYDPTGLRLKKTIAGASVRYDYDNAGRVISAVDANNQSSKYIWGPDKLLVKKDNSGQEYYFLYNGHGDVVQIVNTAGVPVNTYEYDEWGNIASQSETIANDFKYSGEMLDSESGFYYLRSRYYDPTIGRFISKDSVEGEITNPLSLNLYTYVENKPLIYIDPSGQNADVIVKSIWGTVTKTAAGAAEGAELGSRAGFWTAVAGTVIGSVFGYPESTVDQATEDSFIKAASEGGGVSVNDLKRLPNNKVKELGGEDYTQQVKSKSGKSASDLYWNPNTGDVYTVPKGKTGALPQLVDHINPRGTDSGDE